MTNRKTLSPQEKEARRFARKVLLVMRDFSATRHALDQFDPNDEADFIHELAKEFLEFDLKRGKP